LIAKSTGTSWAVPLTTEDKKLESKLQRTLVLLITSADDDRIFHNLHTGLSVDGKEEFEAARKPFPLNAMEVASFPRGVPGSVDDWGMRTMEGSIHEITYGLIITNCKAEPTVVVSGNCCLLYTIDSKICC